MSKDRYKQTHRLSDTEQMLALPIMKHYDTHDVLPASQQWKQGEKSLLTILTFIFAGIFGFVSWVYLLPMLLTFLGEIAGILTTIGAIIAIVFAAPIIYKGLRRITHTIHKLLIKSDPFGELESQLTKMHDNRKQFVGAQDKIKQLRKEMQVEAEKSESEGNNYKELVKKLQEKASKLKATIEDYSSKYGKAAIERDEYVEAQSQLLKTLSEAERVGHLLNQSNQLVQKYGVRANVMGKMDRKLSMVLTAMDIKISDFETSIDMLKKETAFAEASKNATEKAKSAILFTEGWELDYAMEVVSMNIATDLAMAQENLSDINSLTQDFSFNNDDLFAKLDHLADKIKTNDFQLVNAKKFDNLDYQPTPEEIQNSDGFGQLF